MLLTRNKPQLTNQLVSKLVDINTLNEWKDNPRKNDKAAIQLAEVIKQNGGQRTPVVAWSKNMTIYKGNTTYKALKLLGYKQINVILADFKTESAAIAYAIADNKSSELAEWDTSILSRLMQTEEYSFEERSKFGFTENEMAQLIDFEIDENEKENDYTDTSKWLFSQEEIIEEAFKTFREKGFPYPTLNKFECMQELNRLACTAKKNLINGVVGYRIADTYNKHRFHATTASNLSPVESFKKDVSLKKALRKAFENKNLNLKYGWDGWLSLVNGTQACSNFRPAFARYVYEEYASKGATIFDPSTGYGGRLVGFLASHCERYISCDPNTVTCEANKRMVNDLQVKNKSVRLICTPVEDLKVNDLKNTVDLAFTSPPYFSKEIYSKEDTQSCNRYLTIEAWTKGFLSPMLSQCFKVLKNNSYCIINIDDVKIKGVVYPLIELTKENAKQIGFTLEQVKHFKLPNQISNGSHNEKVSLESNEALLIFKKGN